MLELIITILLTILPSCASEDSSMCVWDSATQGNGQGQSFISLGETTITF
jgi:hypothetical protein